MTKVSGSVIVLGVVVLLNTLGNVFIKIHSVRTDGFIKFFPFLGNIISWYLIVGLTCYMLAFFAYSRLVVFVPISIAYPVMNGLVNLFIVLAAVLFFKEVLNVVQIVGLIVIVLGVFLLSFGK